MKNSLIFMGLILPAMGSADIITNNITLTTHFEASTNYYVDIDQATIVYSYSDVSGEVVSASLKYTCDFLHSEVHGCNSSFQEITSMKVPKLYEDPKTFDAPDCEFPINTDATWVFGDACAVNHANSNTSGNLIIDWQSNIFHLYTNENSGPRIVGKIDVVFQYSEPEPANDPRPEPATDPAPAVAPAPEHTTEPASATAPAPEPTTDPAPTPAPEPATEPATINDVEPTTQPIVTPDPASAREPVASPRDPAEPTAVDSAPSEASSEPVTVNEPTEEATPVSNIQPLRATAGGSTNASFPVALLMALMMRRKMKLRPVNH